MNLLIKKSIKSALTEQQLNAIRKISQLGHLAYEDIRVNMLGQVLPMKPITINMLVNDVCNSRCQMCLIWQNKKDIEISPNDLEKILQDDLFSQIKYIGVSGGEPTLRDDLSEFFNVICSKTPKILGTGIITNGIIENTVKQKILECAEICKSHDVNFNIMVSLDGLGEVHDIVRGRKNNFQSSIALLKFFHEETDIPTSFGCTITATNALFVDELLDYAKSEGLYGRFRVAEFIERLYNENQVEYIRAFDEKTKYHLGLFFFRLEHEFEQVPMFQKTYRNIRKMLAEGEPRNIGCPYQIDSVVLTSRGELLYCSPKSPILGDTLKQSAKKIYFSNLNIRNEIAKNDCKSCIHDYHEPITFKEEFNYLLNTKRRKRIYNIQRLLRQSSSILKKQKNINNIHPSRLKKVLIIGWYGTETAGDKAILWSIIQQLQSRENPPLQIYLSSLFPFISRWTVKEMQLNNIKITETYSLEFEKICSEVDEIIIGGGPLMDIEPLDHLLYAFIQGSKTGAVNRVEGCGIGPLISPLYTQVVSEILRLADSISLRDSSSSQRCQSEFGISNMTTIPDPATNYVLNVKDEITAGLNIDLPLKSQANIACFLRDWGRDYASNFSESEYILLKEKFETQLQKMIIFIAKNQKADIHLLPMHSFYIGGDDRIFNRRIAHSIDGQFTDFLESHQVSFTREPISPLEILGTMCYAKFNICMRFHSVLFAETLGVPYLAIDYTQGGKIKAFLEDKGKLNKLISLREIAEEKWISKLNQLLRI
jgi:MoaA/NifB/PqqE/SkfB family radical SAM enzyme/polysaccharide pyruvyl transferase WcaK-like protein